MNTLMKLLIVIGIGVNASFGWWYADTVTNCEQGEVILGSSYNPNIPPASYNVNTFKRACIDPNYFANQQDVIIPKDFNGQNYNVSNYVSKTLTTWAPNRRFVEFKVDYSIPVKNEDSLSVSKVPKYRCPTCTTQIGWTYKKIKRDSASCVDFISGKLRIPFDHPERIYDQSNLVKYKSSHNYTSETHFAKIRMACSEKVVLANKTVFGKYLMVMNNRFPRSSPYNDSLRKLVDYTYGKEPPSEHTTTIKKVVFNKSIQDKIFLINGRKNYK